MDAEKMRARIAQLKQERDQFLTAANVRIGEYNGRLAELEELLAGCSNAVDCSTDPVPVSDNGRSIKSGQS
jgi:hypothetical protein